MKPDIKKQMRRDCRRFMHPCAAAAFFYRLIDAAAPAVAAWLLGDMADHLLALDTKAIASGMAPFLCALVFQTVIAPLLHLILNLLLTKQGFAYDGLLMKKMIRLPLSTVQTTDAGSVMERLEEDSAAFCWNQKELCSLPGAILVYAAGFCCLMNANGCPVPFLLTIVLLAAVPVIRTARIGRLQTELKRQVSEYHDSQKQLEQELYSGRDFAKGFSLEHFFIARLEDRFQIFLAGTGKRQNRLDAQTAVLDFLCSYGVQLGAILAGAVFVSLHQLTLGGLLSGFLMLPSVQLCCSYVKLWITEVHDEKKYLARLAFFYESGEENLPLGSSGECSPHALQRLTAQDLTFTYPGSDAPTLRRISFAMTNQENCRIAGANGSGKTTLMSILAGLYQPQSGQVCDGAPLAQRRKSTALQEQDGTIFSGTIWDNLFLPESRRREAELLLDEMGLHQPLEASTTAEGSNLSPGEKKKLLLARALLRDAPFLLLDEPLNHLDEQGKQALLTHLARRPGGMLLISHEDFPSDILPLRIYEIPPAPGIANPDEFVV